MSLNDVSNVPVVCSSTMYERFVAGVGGILHPRRRREPCTVDIRLLPEPAVLRHVFFVRHGESVWNRAQADMDVATMLLNLDHPLNEAGRQQAEVLRDKIDQVQKSHAAADGLGGSSFVDRPVSPNTSTGGSAIRIGDRGSAESESRSGSGRGSGSEVGIDIQGAMGGGHVSSVGAVSDVGADHRVPGRGQSTDKSVYGKGSARGGGGGEGGGSGLSASTASRSTDYSMCISASGSQSVFGNTRAPCTLHPAQYHLFHLSTLTSSLRSPSFNQTLNLGHLEGISETDIHLEDSLYQW